MEKPPISVCIVCRNEADKLDACLESVTWAHEVLVLDLSSTDSSRAVAERYGARVVSHEPVPMVELVRNTVAALAANDWVLALDPDERISPSLALELGRLSAQQELSAVVIPRMNYDLGYPPSNPLQRHEGQLRMYRRSRVTWPIVPNALPRVPEREVYRLPKVDELVIRHDRSRNIPEVLERSMRYAPLEAEAMLARGQVFTARAMLRALTRVAYTQIVRGEALKDGVPGLLRAFILVGFHFYNWAAFWQASGARRTPEDDRYLRRVDATLQGLRRVLRVGSAGNRLVRRLIRRGSRVW
jgi:glycosyltransferase involved in cell wall biosynthesis